MQRQFITFWIENTYFGIDALLVSEVNHQLKVVPVAGAPEYVCGLLNLRGQIVTIIDLAARLGVGTLHLRPDSKCIVLKSSRMLRELVEKKLLDDNTSPDMIGLLVNQVEDMVTIDDSAIGSSPANLGDIAERFSEGVAQLDSGLLTILRIREIVSFDESTDGVIL